MFVFSHDLHFQLVVLHTQSNPILCVIKSLLYLSRPSNHLRQYNPFHLGFLHTIIIILSINLAGRSWPLISSHWLDTHFLGLYAVPALFAHLKIMTCAAPKQVINTSVMGAQFRLNGIHSAHKNTRGVIESTWFVRGASNGCRTFIQYKVIVNRVNARVRARGVMVIKDYPGEHLSNRSGCDCGYLVLLLSLSAPKVVPMYTLSTRLPPHRRPHIPFHLTRRRPDAVLATGHISVSWERLGKWWSAAAHQTLEGALCRARQPCTRDCVAHGTTSGVFLNEIP